MSDLPLGEQPQPQRIRINTITNILEFTTNNGVTWSAVAAAAATPTGGFGLMAARAAAWGAALATPYVFNDAYQEDFALGALTVGSAKGGTGSDPTFSTTATNYGSAGIMQLAGGGTLDTAFAIAGPVNANAFIADLKTTTFYCSSYAKVTGVLTQVNALAGVGVLGAETIAGASKFIVIGAIDSASTTKWGITMYNGTTQTFHAGAVAFDQTAFHYLDLAHDAVAHVYYFYVDGTLVDSVSDAGMASSIGGTAWAGYVQATTLGVQINKAYCAV